MRWKHYLQRQKDLRKIIALKSGITTMPDWSTMTNRLAMRSSMWTTMNVQNLGYNIFVHLLIIWKNTWQRIFKRCFTRINSWRPLLRTARGQKVASKKWQTAISIHMSSWRRRLLSNVTTMWAYVSTNRSRFIRLDLPQERRRPITIHSAMPLWNIKMSKAIGLLSRHQLTLVANAPLNLKTSILRPKQCACVRQRRKIMHGLQCVKLR